MRPVACHNTALAAERAGQREALLQSRERPPAPIAAAVAKRPARHDRAAIGHAVGWVVGKHKMKKHVAFEIEDGRFANSCNRDEIEAEAAARRHLRDRHQSPKNEIGAEADVAA